MIPDLTAIPALLGQTTGAWWGIAAAMLFPCLLVLPLRGGHGEHSHAGPGSLNVWQLSDTPSGDHANRATEELPEEIIWPPEATHPEPDHDGFDPWAGDEPSTAERELAALLHLFPDEPEQGYVGRHRLAEPHGFGAPVPGPRRRQPAAA